MAEYKIDYPKDLLLEGLMKGIEPKEVFTPVPIVVDSSEGARITLNLIKFHYDDQQGFILVLGEPFSIVNKIVEILARRDLK